MTLLKVKAVQKQIDEDFSLRPISFTQRKLQKIAVAGETGSGKSTLLRIIAGLAQADQGEVIFSGEKLAGPDDRLVPGHPQIAYLSQHFELPKFLRVEQVLSYANTLPDHEAQTLYEVCQIDHLVKRKTDQLSGGERQRIAMARLLITSPKLLLLDEPFTHLDMVHKNTLKMVIRDIGEKLKITCILVSHDPQDTLPWADKILVMKDGRVIQKGTPEEIYEQPVNEYAAGLFGRYNALAFDEMKALKAKSAKKKKKKFIVRPENIRLVRKNGKALRGKVEQVSFLGSHRELEISALGKKLFVKTNANKVDVGDTVYLELDA